MWELIIGILCCLGMAGSLFGYLQWYKKKYKRQERPSAPKVMEKPLVKL